MIFTYKDIKINYTRSGKGPSIVFLHGFLENLSMWEEMTTVFSKKYHCIAIDLLGHGNTECLGYIHTMEEMAKAIKSVLDHLEIKNATFIGHSMGGYAALAYLELFASEVSRLVLLNSTSFPDSEERKLNRTRAIDIVKKNPNAYTSMAIANLFAEKNRTKFRKEINHIKNQASRTPLQGIISALEGMKIRKDQRATLSGFKNPKIILSGKLDPVLNYSQNFQEAQECKTKLVSFDGGHMSYIENKKDLLFELQKFMDL